MKVKKEWLVIMNLNMDGEHTHTHTQRHIYAHAHPHAQILTHKLTTHALLCTPMCTHGYTQSETSRASSVCQVLPSGVILSANIKEACMGV